MSDSKVQGVAPSAPGSPLQASLSTSIPNAVLPAIDRDEQMDRSYIPLPGGWELQTQGKGSTLRLCDTKTGERHPLLLPDHIIKFMERMGFEVHAAARAIGTREGGDACGSGSEATESAVPQGRAQGEGQ
jgi:hypothetical protein